MESHPRERMLPVPTLKVCLQGNGRCSAWPRIGVSNRKGAKRRIGQVSCRGETRGPHEGGTPRLCQPPTHPFPRFRHVLWSTGTKRCVGTRLCLLFLTRSHSCNLTQSLSRKIWFQRGPYFLQRKGCESSGSLSPPASCPVACTCSSAPGYPAGLAR